MTALRLVPDLSGEAELAAARFLEVLPTLDLPLPGSGLTWERWRALAEIARRDLCVARLAEGHTDAVAILSELDGPRPVAGSRWAVWAAEPPSPVVEAEQTTDGWRLTGTKPWCSGAHVSTHALVTARVGDRSSLFAVDLTAVRTAPVEDGWPAVGMAGSDSGPVRFHAAPAVRVGDTGQYVDRPGFWHGAIGVAACWYGGALGVADTLLRQARTGRADPHALAHLGAVDAVLHAARATLIDAALEIDTDPEDLAGTGQLRAMRVRAVVEAACDDVLRRVGRATGAGPHGRDADFSRRIADLTVFLRQSHAERDLAGLGALLADGAAPSW